ncbi:MAG: helix-turn-helix domain-containing protein [Candidatus Cryptobacteroides sp.]
MDRVNYIEFGRNNDCCRTSDDGLVMWKLSGGAGCLPVSLYAEDSLITAHFVTAEGSVEVERDGHRYHLTKDNVANFLDCSSLEVMSVSDDAKAYVLLFTPAFIVSLLNPPPFPPSFFLKTRVNPVAHITGEGRDALVKRLGAMEELLFGGDHRFRAGMMRCLLTMFMMELANEHLRCGQDDEIVSGSGRKCEIFKQFIKLMTDSIRQQHTVEWYASQLCVTPQYLNRAVKSTSKKTAYDHLCACLTGALQEDLKSSRSSLSQIAENFNFPDLATMTKFFKRHTGMTPSEYRRRQSSGDMPSKGPGILR